MKLSNSTGRLNDRRIQVVKRLQQQLNSGVKIEKGLPITTTDLTEQDKRRIEAEITILQGRIVPKEAARNRRTKIYRGA